MLKKIDFLDLSPIYSIDECGNIFSNVKNGYLKPAIDKDGYLTITLSKGSRKELARLKIATIVIQAFIGDAPSDMIDPTVDHIDGNKTNNYYENLRWLERGENARRAHVAVTIGDKNHFYKKEHSNEVKEKLKEVNTGKKYSDEVNMKKASPKKSVLLNKEGKEILFSSAKELSEYLETTYVTCVRYLRGDRGGSLHYYKAKDCYLFYESELDSDILKDIFGSTGK